MCAEAAVAFDRVRTSFVTSGFVAVEKAEGCSRWALWMEISGRLQVAQSACRAVLQKDKKAEFVDQPGWKIKNDR